MVGILDGVLKTMCLVELDRNLKYDGSGFEFVQAGAKHTDGVGSLDHCPSSGNDPRHLCDKTARRSTFKLNSGWSLSRSGGDGRN